MLKTILIVGAIVAGRLLLRMRTNKARYTVKTVRSIEKAPQFYTHKHTRLCDPERGNIHRYFCPRRIVRKNTAPVPMTKQDISTGFRMIALKAVIEDVFLYSGSIKYVLAGLRCFIRMRPTRLKLQVREFTNSALGFDEPALAFRFKRKALLVVSETNHGHALITKLSFVNGFDISVLSKKALS